MKSSSIDLKRVLDLKDTLALYLPGSPSALARPVEWGLVALWFLLGGVLYRFR